MGQQRKRLMIDPPVQWAVARRVAVHWFCFFALLIVVNSIIGMLLNVPEKTLIDSGIEAVRNQMPQVIIMLLILPVFLRDTIRLSNRFAGPMYRLRIGLGALAEKKVQGAIKFRKGDFWHDVADRFNSVRARIDELESTNRSLEEQNQKLKKELEARSASLVGNS